MKFLLDKYIAGLCFYRTAFPVQKSGLKSSAFRSKSFPQISSESYRHNAVPNHFSSHFSTSHTNAPRSLSRVKVGTHSPFGEESHTAAHRAKQGPSLPRPQHGFALPVKFLLFCHALYTYISRFSVNPHHQQREKIRQSYRHGSISSRFSTSPTNGPRSLSWVKMGTHPALEERSHTPAHTPKQGAFRTEVVSLLSERSARSPTSPGRVSERRTLPLLGLGREVLSKNAESLRDSDALMRVAVPKASRPRWAA